MTITDRDPGDESEAAMTDERAAVEHKRCPLCGSRPRVENHKRLGLEAWCGGDEDKPCFMRRWPIPLDQWNTRPIEDALRAENERLLREQAEFTGAALCALGLNRDEYVSPGNQVLDEINRLTTKVSELTRLLGEAEGAIREAADETSGEPEFSDERCSYETIQVSYGWRKEWRESAPVQRALKGASL